LFFQAVKKSKKLSFFLEKRHCFGAVFAASISIAVFATACHFFASFLVGTRKEGGRRLKAVAKYVFFS